MAKLSISKAWDETRDVLSREGKLLTTVALALIVLPGVIQELFAPAVQPGKIPPLGAWVIVVFACILIGLIGQLAIIRLATGPATTVGEAITHGARRLPYYLGVVVLVFVPPLLAMYALAQQFRGPTPSGGAAIAFLLLTVLFIYILVRFVISSAVSSAENIGPIGIIQRTWSMTRGSWWRLFAFVLLFLIAVLLLMVATGAIVGIVVGILLGTPEPMSVGALIAALITQLVMAAITVVFVVMIARIYLQLARQNVEATVPSTGD